MGGGGDREKLAVSQAREKSLARQHYFSGSPTIILSISDHVHSLFFSGINAFDHGHLSARFVVAAKTFSPATGAQRFSGFARWPVEKKYGSARTFAGGGSKARTCVSEKRRRKMWKDQVWGFLKCQTVSSTWELIFFGKPFFLYRIIF